MAYWQVEPFGSPVDDHRFEQLLALTFQSNTPANTPTPRFFDRRSADEIARDERLERIRNRETMTDLLSAFFDRHIARQDEDAVVGQVDSVIEITS